MFNGNPRVNAMNKSDKEDWDRLINLVSKDDRLKNLNIGTSFPVYENSNIKPHEFFVDKTFVVIGSDDIYQKFHDLDTSFSVGNEGFIFIEDGKFDPANLQNVASTSAILVFNDKSETDLKMSFLQKNFVSVNAAYKKEWSTFAASDYLDYKYQLLIRNIKINDFDYGLGVALSTKAGEKMSFRLNVPVDGDYILAIRKLDEKNQNMTWQFEEKNNLKHGSFDYVYENKEGVEVLNTVALISTEDMRIATQLTKNFLGTFTHFELNNQSDDLKIEKILKTSKWENFDINEIKKAGWIIQTDSYNPNWVIHKGDDYLVSYPMYSMVNSFYVTPEWGKVNIVFKGDEEVKWGIYFSLMSFLVIVVVSLWKVHKRSLSLRNKK